ncbi:MAG: hypothetical protein KDA28_10330, partial [Phycisphaerales bacterium]|nr:hypothetical protein [Phycisphaerales bacterium]
SGNVATLFPGMEVEEILAFRVTRNAAIQQDDDEIDDLLEHVEAELRMRRFARPVRLEIKPHDAPGVLAFLMEELELSSDDVYERPGLLDFTSLFLLGDLDRPELKDRPHTPVPPPALADEDVDIFAVMRDRDILLHHPYESFRFSVERFIARAARDPDVLAIKQTLYRTSRDSPFVASLVRAAEEGKQVACLVELRARFDEQKNVRFARTLEKAGVHVAYGVLGLKTHCKCSLVVRREEHGLRCYAHVGTGNYHPDTAQLYTDLGLLTCDPAITSDMVHVFNALTGHGRQSEYESFLVAPFTMRSRIYEQIDREIEHARAGRPARIIAKMNSMEDRRVAARL